MGMSGLPIVNWLGFVDEKAHELRKVGHLLLCLACKDNQPIRVTSSTHTFAGDLPGGVPHLGPFRDPAAVQVPCLQRQSPQRPLPRAGHVAAALISREGTHEYGFSSSDVDGPEQQAMRGSLLRGDGP